MKKKLPRKTKKALKDIRVIKHPLGFIVRYAILGKITKRKLYLFWVYTYSTRSLPSFPTKVLRFKDEKELDRWLKGQTSVTFEPKRKKSGIAE